jgi:hypothetical protein
MNLTMQKSDAKNYAHRCICMYFHSDRKKHAYAGMKINEKCFVFAHNSLPDLYKKPRKLKKQGLCLRKNEVVWKKKVCNKLKSWNHGTRIYSIKSPRLNVADNRLLSMVS